MVNFFKFDDDTTEDGNEDIGDVFSVDVHLVFVNGLDVDRDIVVMTEVECIICCSGWCWVVDNC